MSKWEGFKDWLEKLLLEKRYSYGKLALAFVFFYFGIQKWPIIAGHSPVRAPVKAFVESFGFGSAIPIPPIFMIMMIGTYEFTLGMMFFVSWLEDRIEGQSALMNPATLMFIVHQVITFLPLIMVPEEVFRTTALFGSLWFPVALDWMSAFIFKNLIFIGLFSYIFIEWRRRERGEFVYPKHREDFTPHGGDGTSPADVERTKSEIEDIVRNDKGEDKGDESGEPDKI